ncbi:MAG: carboxypeptidase-like regulatory domain-containing protein [candidate division KSB1 bacterium]|nr:carboxypeptidase-like regulatory domain-containing protein [candidate division KSB1 bacterium]MDZ7365253.1 carboxypeptidase-like regulatory domain-containing protein [candidate division KSB1 bacterium]MDZ7403120.1 carboxypeptidase-like regulatory domain-containing protein [candidate division KSB1 bacterium]
MMASPNFKKVFAACLGFALFAACEKSPINGEISNPPNLQIRGRIQLADNNSAEGIHVWLGNTSLTTRTDKDGAFVLALPPSASGSPVFASGIFNVYFYVANYKLISTPVTIHEGKFLYSRGQVNQNGELISTLSMPKLLNIKTTVDPPVVPPSFSQTIRVIVALSAVHDSVVVVFPKMIGGQLGGVLFRELNSGGIYADAPEDNAGTRAVEKIGNEPRLFRFDFSLKPGVLPLGNYEIIPYFLIEQQNMPDGLLASISERAGEIGPDFLKIPFRREGGLFAIRDVQGQER